ncbi:MAG: hypothetical protein QF903_02270 [Planctomycetota bacterium]|nr:hypothetical protein [Planctomycetota bacterium]MDP6764196.1 hypothetical protein [Planctomycetota bacterium]MDP6988285.1 hypothetical protein [Planctomycetota bacterium]
MTYGTCPNCSKSAIVLYQCIKCGSVQCSWCSSSCYACGGQKKPM